MKKGMIYTLVVFLILLLATVWVMNLPVFGKVPEGARLERIKRLPNYKDGMLENLSPTPMKPDNVSYWDMLSAFFKGNKRGTPSQEIPTVKPDFSVSEQTKIIWFGHSSYLVQVDGLNVLVDPVFSKRASPFSFIGSENFHGTDFVKVEDFPVLDVVLITHDHYDHLDYHTILKLNGKAKRFITSLGVAAHLEYWGVSPEKITELSWNEGTAVGSLKFTALPARHFTGRLFKRNQTLWSAFVLQGAKEKLYLGGDSGYDTHFKKAGQEFGPFDIAVLECGQYNDYWPLIHMFPEQTVQAAIDLNAKVLLPVHWGKFTLAMHDWDEPVIRVVKEARKQDFKITTPMMGEPIILGKNYPTAEWWLF